MNFFLTVLPYIVTVIILYIILKLVAVPFKVIVKLILNSVLGGLAILIINYFGASYGICIGLNIFTSVFVGITGLPGVLVLILLTYFL